MWEDEILGLLRTCRLNHLGGEGLSGEMSRSARYREGNTDFARKGWSELGINVMIGPDAPRPPCNTIREARPFWKRKREGDSKPQLHFVKLAGSRDWIITTCKLKVSVRSTVILSPVARGEVL